MHDPLDAAVIFWAEIDQRRDTGQDVEAAIAAGGTCDFADRGAVSELMDSLDALPRSAVWPYEEPSSLEDILSVLPAPARMSPPSRNDIEDKIHAAWLGRIAGCNLGKPVEIGTELTPELLREYLEPAGAYPILDYIPLLEQMPDGFRLRQDCLESTRGNIDGSARDDDIDYAILGLHLLERHGSALSPQRVAEEWLVLLPFRQVYTAERAAYRNLVDGLTPPETATHHNPYREWIGALIRADVYGWVHPGDPRAAALLAYQDASLSHTANGIYGEMWAAALISSAFTAGTAWEALESSLEHVPPRSRLVEVVRDVMAQHASGGTWEDALAHIRCRYGHYSWAHTLNNVALVVAGLLWGEREYARTVGLTVQGCWDTDSSSATSGSVAGVLLGTAALPRHFVDPLHDRTRSALFGFDNSRISGLAARTARLAVEGLG